MVNSPGVLRRLAEDFFRADALDAGDILADVPDEGAVAADAAHRLRGHVGAVRLEDDLLQRQSRNGLCRPFGTLEGAGAAEAEIQPLPGQPHGVVRTAGIAVDDALGTVLFQQGVDVGVGVSVVDDDGLVQLKRKADLRLKQRQLCVFGTGQW